MNNCICPRCWGMKVYAGKTCYTCDGVGAVGNMELSKSFDLGEMTASETAMRKGINNDPPEEVVRNLSELCIKLLEPINDVVPIRISSGYRSVPLNTAIGGSATSVHCQGLAADFSPLDPKKVSRKQLLQKILELKLSYDQIIYEGTWIHIGLRSPRGTVRGERLMMFNSHNGPQYSLLNINDPRVV